MNLLVRAPGTPLADAPDLDPLELVRTVACARIVAPRARVRLSAGRLSLTPEAQALCVMAGANSIFSGDRLLTTPNPAVSEDERLMAQAGPPLRGVRRAVTPLEEHRAALAEALAARERAGLLRRLHPPRGIDLVSNDYLGLATHPHVMEGAAAAIARLGAGTGGSRLLTGHRDAFAELEERLAAFSGTEAALLFGSGYAANLGLLTAVVGWDDLVVSDHRNHASLIDGIRLTGARRVVHAHRDLAAIGAALRQPRPGRAFVVTESVYSMDGDLSPLAELAEVAERYGALMIVDEAHATGLYGASRSGARRGAGPGRAASSPPSTPAARRWARRGPGSRARACSWTRWSRPRAPSSSPPPPCRR